MHINELVTKYIIHSVADYYGITEEQLCLGDRRREYSEPRHVAAYCLRSFAGMEYKTIGRLFGGKTHRAIIYAVTKVDDWRKKPILNKKAAECIAYVLTNNKTNEEETKTETNQM